jgi:hypothetical protein
MAREFVTQDDVINHLKTTLVLIAAYTNPDYSLKLDMRASDQTYIVSVDGQIIEATKDLTQALMTYNTYYLPPENG